MLRYAGPLPVKLNVGMPVLVAAVYVPAVLLKESRKLNVGLPVPSVPTNVPPASENVPVTVWTGVPLVVPVNVAVPCIVRSPLIDMEVEPGLWEPELRIR
jgi:hypothetical protein